MASKSTKYLLFIILLVCSLPAWAEKTYLVFLKNGDRVTGEIKSLNRGILEVKTDHMGTVYIEWEDIEEVISNIGQSVELIDGQRLYGPLAKPESDDIVSVETENGTVGVNTLDIVEMYPVAAGFWNRLDLSARLGFSWDKGSSVGRYTLGIDSVYKDPNYVTRANFVTEVTT